MTQQNQLAVKDFSSPFMQAYTHLMTHCSKIDYFIFHTIFRNREKIEISILYNFFNSGFTIYSLISFIIFEI